MKENEYNKMFEKLTKIALDEYIKYCEQHNIKDNCIIYLKHSLEYMENIENNTGILTKNFVKKLLNRENELENTIFELKEQIKALESSDAKGNDVPICYDIFMKMIKYASVNMSLGDSYNMPTLSISDCPLMPDEVEYISRLISERENELMTGFMGKKIGRISVDRVDAGIGVSPMSEYDLISGRAYS